MLEKFYEKYKSLGLKTLKVKELEQKVKELEEKLHKKEEGL